jgi:hypothetical protein
MFRRCPPSATTPARLLALTLVVGAAVPALEHAREWGVLRARISSVGAPTLDPLFWAAIPTGPTTLLASWQTVGGCGAGSATGIGGIKWIGHNVTGGVVHVQSQGNYTRLEGGYSFALQNQLTADLSEKWNLGVVVPFLYKWIDNYADTGYALSNGGLGDINFLVTRRLGAVNDTTFTLSLGVPTGTHEANCQLSANKVLFNCLPQDRQLGTGTVSGAVLLEHTVDNLWGPLVYGGTVAYPGGENTIHNYRAPSASLYGYAGYLVGPLTPALGVSVTQFLHRDRDNGFDTERGMTMLATSASLEWANSWMAVLAGVSVPFSGQGLEPWTAGLGIAFAPF